MGFILSVMYFFNNRVFLCTQIGYIKNSLTHNTKKKKKKKNVIFLNYKGKRFFLTFFFFFLKTVKKP